MNSINNHRLGKYEKKLIGVLTVPVNVTQKVEERDFLEYTSFVADSHIQLFSGTPYVIIPYTMPHTEMRKYFDHISLLYIPGGRLGNYNEKQFVDSVRFLMKEIKRINELGTYLPIWGICLGFQTMLQVDNTKLHHSMLLDKFDSRLGYMTNLNHTGNSKMRMFFKKDEIHQLENRIDKLHNHGLGITKEKLKDAELSNDYQIVHMNIDRKGKSFISTIEHKKYPFYGFQWHPEKSENVEMFRRFFLTELRKTPDKPPIDFIYEQPKTMDCKNLINLNDTCYFFK